MNRPLKAAILIFASITICGCVGAMISQIRGLSSISTKTPLKENNPLRISRSKASHISILALGYPTLRMSAFPDRFKEFQLRVIHAELEKTKRFKLVHFTNFKNAEPEIMQNLHLGLFWEPLTDQQRKEVIKKIGERLNAEAVLLVKEITPKVSMAKAVATDLLVGVIDIPTILSFEVASVSTGETIWRQEQELVYRTGEAFIDFMSDEEIIGKIRPSVEPLINNLMASFR